VPPGRLFAFRHDTKRPAPVTKAPASPAEFGGGGTPARIPQRTSAAHAIVAWPYGNPMAAAGAFVCGEVHDRPAS